MELSTSKHLFKGSPQGLFLKSGAALGSIYLQQPPQSYFGSFGCSRSSQGDLLYFTHQPESFVYGGFLNVNGEAVQSNPTGLEDGFGCTYVVTDKIWIGTPQNTITLFPLTKRFFLVGIKQGYIWVEEETANGRESYCLAHDGQVWELDRPAGAVAMLDLRDYYETMVSGGFNLRGYPCAVTSPYYNNVHLAAFAGVIDRVLRIVPMAFGVLDGGRLNLERLIDCEVAARTVNMFASSSGSGSVGAEDDAYEDWEYGDEVAIG